MGANLRLRAGAGWIGDFALWLVSAVPRIVDPGPGRLRGLQ
jgi:hypothetical protein